MTGDHDKKSAFTQALTAFRALVDRNSETAKTFAAAYVALKEEKLHGLQMETDAYDEAVKPFMIDGKTMPGPALLAYLADAIDLYERRKDAHQGTTARLFNRKCLHMKALRQMIALVKETSDGKDAATMLEAALNEVQKNPYKPKTAPDDGAVLRVTGYTDTESSPRGMGIVVREYGDPKGLPDDIYTYKGQAIIEVAAEGLAPQLRERNAILNYVHNKNDAPVDFTVITKDGAAHGFNYHAPKASPTTHALRQLAGEPHPATPLAEFIAQIEGIRSESGAGIDTVLSAEQQQKIVDLLLPAIVKNRPPQVQIERGQGR